MQRWSRLKGRTRRDEDAPAAVAASAPQASGAPPEAPAPVSPDAAGADDKAATKPSELPPIESLNSESDYTAFMRPGVPEDLRTKALRRLWQSDALFAQIDFTEPYSGDFNAVPTFPDGLKSTLYRVGKGMIEAVEEERAEKPTQPAESAPPRDGDHPDSDASRDAAQASVPAPPDASRRNREPSPKS